MAVVQIGIMRVLVDERQVAMPMRVRLALRVARSMPVLVVRVMGMAVLVLERLVPMLVLMRLGEVEIEADRHQQPGEEQPAGHGLAEQGDRDEGANERRRREIGAGAGGAEMPQTEHE